MQERQALLAQLSEAETRAEEQIAAAESAERAAASEKAGLQSELSAMSKKLKEAEQAAARATQDAASERERLDMKIQNQRQASSFPLICRLHWPISRHAKYRSDARVYLYWIARLCGNKCIIRFMQAGSPWD